MRVSVLKASVVAAIAAAAFAAGSLAPVTGQSRAGGVPRVNGKPDLNGLWQAVNSANWDIQAHTAKAALAMRPGPIVPVPAKEVIAFGAAGAVPSGAGVVEGDELPYTADGLKKKQENQQNWLTRDPEIKCYLPGVPRGMYMPFPVQIIQSPQHIMIVHEYAGAVRTVYMDNHVEAPADSWMGWSNGHWEGETLVIDTKGFNDLSWFDRAGNFHSDGLHVVERITARSADTLTYEATIEDPKVFTRAWKISMPLYRHVEANAQILEFRCVEFVEDLMYGHLKKQPSK